MIVYDAAGVKTAVSPDGSGSVYDANGRRISSTSVLSTLYSFDNVPVAPSAYDDEFNSGTLDAKWTVTSVGTTNPAVPGTVNPVSSLTTPVYDLATWPSWLLLQSDNSSAQYVRFSQPLSPSANATMFLKCSMDNRFLSSASECTVYMNLYKAADTNEEAASYVSNVSGAGFSFRLRVNNNGALSITAGTAMSEAAQLGPFYVTLWKSGNNYYGGYAQSDGMFTVFGPHAKTGVTDVDTLEISFYTANETPSVIMGVDFFRYYPTLTYALKNPAL